MKAAAEIQMLYGAGTTNEFLGYAGDSDVQTYLWSTAPAGSNRVDALIYAETKVKEIGNRMIVMNPTDWALLKTLKDSNGQYLVGKSGAFEFNDGAIPVVNGMPVILTNGCNVGDFFIINPPPVAADLALLDAGTLDFGLVNDQFIKNELTARFELSGIHVIKNVYAYVYGQWNTAP